MARRSTHGPANHHQRRGRYNSLPPLIYAVRDWISSRSAYLFVLFLRLSRFVFFFFSSLFFLFPLLRRALLSTARLVVRFFSSLFPRFSSPEKQKKNKRWARRGVVNFPPFLFRDVSSSSSSSSSWFSCFLFVFVRSSFPLLFFLAPNLVRSNFDVENDHFALLFLETHSISLSKQVKNENGWGWGLGGLRFIAVILSYFLFSSVSFHLFSSDRFYDPRQKNIRKIEETKKRTGVGGGGEKMPPPPARPPTHRVDQWEGGGADRPMGFDLMVLPRKH